MYLAIALIGSAVVGAMGSSSAASQQQSGIQSGQQLTQQQFNTITAQEQPYVSSGYGAMNQLDYLMGIGPSNGYNAQPGPYNNAMAPYASIGASNSSPFPWAQAGPQQPSSNAAQQGTVYGVNGTTPNYGMQAGSPTTPTPTTPTGTTAAGVAGHDAHAMFSLGDFLNPLKGISTPSNPLGATGQVLNATNSLGLTNVSAPGVSGNKSSAPAATASTSATSGQGWGGAPGTYTPSTSAAGGYGSLNAPFTADMMKQYSPAYQFQLQQGGQGVLNTDSANVGAESGAAFKDLMGYNQNMANTAFNNAFNQYQTQQDNTYQRLMGMTTIGQNAAANVGAQGTQLAGNQASLAASYGAAGAAGTVGATNAISSSANMIPWLMAYNG